MGYNRIPIIGHDEIRPTDIPLMNSVRTGDTVGLSDDNVLRIWNPQLSVKQNQAAIPRKFATEPADQKDTLGKQVW
jgi:hypothetical protein